MGNIGVGFFLENKICHFRQQKGYEIEKNCDRIVDSRLSMIVYFKVLRRFAKFKEPGRLSSLFLV